MNQDAGLHSVLVTGASSGFGALTVRTLATAGHTVYAGMRGTTTRNRDAVVDLERFAAETRSSATAVEMDVSDEVSVQAGIDAILDRPAGLDVIVHNAGHLLTGPAEAFTPAQLAEMYDVDVLGTQRVNRAALPHLREQGNGLLIWVGSSSTRGGYPPFLGPYVAAKAAGDALAVSYASELIRFGVETTIVIPGRFEQGTSHFANAGAPADADRVDVYRELIDDVGAHLRGLVPIDARVQDVADEIGRVVALRWGERPLRTHVDPVRGGSEVVSAVADRIRADYFRRIGMPELLTSGASL